MVSTLPPKVEIDPSIQQRMDDHAFAVEVRRALIILAKALARRYNIRWVLIVLNVEG